MEPYLAVEWGNDDSQVVSERPVDADKWEQLWLVGSEGMRSELCISPRCKVLHPNSVLPIIPHSE